jgi:small redox-active disulfide protein 2
MRMVIKILGSGCANCQTLEQRAHEAAEKLGIEAEIVKVQDFADIMRYGVMSTPALVVDEEVKMAGRVPSVDEVADILAGAR